MVSEQQHGKWSQNAGALEVVQQVEGVANHFGQVCQVLVPDGVFQAVVEREFFDSRHKLLQQLVLDDGSGGLCCAFVAAHVVVHVRGNLKEVLRLLENDASIFWHLLLLVASTTVLDAPRCLKSKASFGGRRNTNMPRWLTEVVNNKLWSLSKRWLTEVVRKET